MKFAVIKTGGNQYLVEEGDTIKVEKLSEEEGDSIKFDKVLLRSTNRSFKLGDPFVEDYKVGATIKEHGREDKVVTFKKKPKERHEKTKGHKQPYTKIEIDSI